MWLLSPAPVDIISMLIVKMEWDLKFGLLSYAVQSFLRSYAQVGWNQNGKCQVKPWGVSVHFCSTSCPGIAEIIVFIVFLWLLCILTLSLRSLSISLISIIIIIIIIITITVSLIIITNSSLLPVAPPLLHQVLTLLSTLHGVKWDVWIKILLIGDFKTDSLCT